MQQDIVLAVWNMAVIFNESKTAGNTDNGKLFSSEEVESIWVVVPILQAGQPVS